MNIHLHKKLVYKVVYGFDKGEWWRIEEDELEKFLYAHRSKKVVATKGKQINGGNIIRIEEDWHYYTGWNYDYVPTNAEDQKQIERDAPIKALAERLVLAEARVKHATETNNISLLSNPSQIQLPEATKMVSKQAESLANKLRFNEQNRL